MPRDPLKHPFDDRLRAVHMLTAACDAIAMVTDRQRVDLETDVMLRRAQVNAVQEIGEAAAKVSAVGRARLSNLPWQQIIGMRNRLVHGYDEINLDILWNVANRELAVLIRAMEDAVKNWPISDSRGT